jgi:hypothetical protein
MVRDYHQDAGGAGTRYSAVVNSTDEYCDLDMWESDDSYYPSPEITTDGRWQRHNFCALGADEPADDRDWVWFWTPAQKTYALETRNLGPDSDTILRLYDHDGQTLMWDNDDVGPGRESRILWTFDREGIYYLEVVPFAFTGSGKGTEYDLRVNPSMVLPTPTPTPIPTPTPTPTPPPSAKTLILTNRERLEALYEETETSELMTALSDLAGHPNVQGVVFDVSQDRAAIAAYGIWDTAPTSVSSANQVADAVRSIVVRHMNQSRDLEYVVLVGDDRVIPYRRVADRPELTGAYESEYPDPSPGSSVSSALAGNYSLNDDFYGDRVAQTWDGQPMYLPDVAVARLVETPADIAGTIESFLAKPERMVNQAMVVGYSVLTDGAQEVCAWWQWVGVPGLDCDLIGDGWGAPELHSRQLDAVHPFDLQALATGANHYLEGTPNGTRVSASDIASASSDLRGALIWNTGRYTGLNVPPGIPAFELDLPEAFARKNASYIGNTGNTLVGNGAPLLAERLMSTFARQLTLEPSTSIGKAWMRAKRLYTWETLGFSEYDRKVLSVATLFGLPMSALHTGAGTLGDPFPSVTLTLSPTGGLGDPVSGTLHLDLEGGLAAFSRTTSLGGDYFSLDDHVGLSPGMAAQPQFYASTINWGLGPIKGLVWTEGLYSDSTDFEPLKPQAVVAGGVVSETGSVPLILIEIWDRWSPAVPALVQGEQGEMLSVILGQYSEERATERLYTDMTFDLYLGAAPDYTLPQIDWAVSRRDGVWVTVKIEANDNSGIQRAVVTYTYGDGRWQSQELVYSPDTHKWFGVLPAWKEVTWFAQVVDNAGNVAHVSNKGSYYYEPQTIHIYSTYLPLIEK